MAKEQKTKPEPEPVVVVQEETPPPPRSYRIHILLGLVVIALAQTTFLFFLLPSQTQIAQQLLDLKGEVLNNDDIYQVPTEVAPIPDLQKEPLVEKILGDKFKVQSIRQGTEQITDVFTVTIVVQILKKDEIAYDKLYAERQNAIRDAVTIVLRASSLDNRNQPFMVAIRRDVQKAVNEVLGISYVRGVLCLDPIVEMI
ncbi:MAG: hypothetical protein LBI18_09800 [Planctomycetaceae bacterium]|jgi:hypothetical protein|nr:hypothetical protein [Planctomycetaceae bacterium]